MKNTEIKTKSEIEVKRFYLPIVAKVKCPHCGHENEHDFDDNYLSYPTLNKEEPIYMCCDKCDGEFEFDIKLKISMDIGTEMRKL